MSQNMLFLYLCQCKFEYTALIWVRHHQRTICFSSNFPDNIAVRGEIDRYIYYHYNGVLLLVDLLCYFSYLIGSTLCVVQNWHILHIHIPRPHDYTMHCKRTVYYANVAVKLDAIIYFAEGCSMLPIVSGNIINVILQNCRYILFCKLHVMCIIGNVFIAHYTSLQY